MLLGIPGHMTLQDRAAHVNSGCLGEPQAPRSVVSLHSWVWSPKALGFGIQAEALVAKIQQLLDDSKPAIKTTLEGLQAFQGDAPKTEELQLNWFIEGKFRSFGMPVFSPGVDCTGSSRQVRSDPPAEQLGPRKTPRKSIHDLTPENHIWSQRRSSHQQLPSVCKAHIRKERRLIPSSAAPGFLTITLLIQGQMSASQLFASVVALILGSAQSVAYSNIWQA